LRLFSRPHALGLVVLVLAGCGDKPAATPVAAKVNGEAITVQQVDQAMQRLGNVPEGQGEQAQKQILERLVDQHLLAQQAIEKKLDRDPRVTQAIEAARRQILAQAYVEGVVGGPEKAGGAEKIGGDTVKEFYAQHPELFRERRVYRFAQMTVEAPPERRDAIRAKLEELDKQPDKGRILPQLADWLRSENLRFRVTQATQGAEQLPLETLPQYHRMKPGDLMFAPAAQGVTISQLTAAQTQPLSEEQAQPFIEQYLQNRERARLSDAEIKRLRAAAKIEYLGDFAKLQERPSPASPEAGSPAADQPAPATDQRAD
jgi:EpsD family peptidyl-prolyl cis-trans isomerase